MVYISVRVLKFGKAAVYKILKLKRERRLKEETAPCTKLDRNDFQIS